MKAAAPSAIAVLGLGAMGLPMARRLSGRFGVRGFDPDPARRSEAARAGIVVFETPLEAVAGVSIAVLAMRTLEQAHSCLFAADGALPGLADGSVVVLTSTVGPEGALALDARLRERAVSLVDAPVSGGVRRAEAGSLLILVSGSEPAVSAADPVLAALGSNLVAVGPRVGDGQSMKVVNQLLCGVHIAAAGEALVLARALGIEPAAALQALSQGAAESFMLSDRGPRIVEQLAGGTPEVRSRLDIFVKDMGLVEAAADAAGLDLPVAQAAARLYERGAEQGLASGDDSGISLIYRQRS